MGDRVRAFLADYGPAALDRVAEAILSRSEAAMRAGIAGLPDGVYRGTVTGDGFRTPTHIALALTIHGDSLTLDYTGSSPQRPDASINCVPNVTFAHSVFAIKCLLVPDGAGAASALGLVASPVAFDFSRSCPQRLDQAVWTEISAVFPAMRREGEAVLRDAGVDVRGGQGGFSYRMDMRHLGQRREITVEIPAALIEAGDLGGICECFYQEHRQRFGHVHRHLPVELISCRTTAQGPEIAFPLRHVPPAGPVAPKAWRPVFFPEAACFLDTPVYERSALGSDFAAQGPAMIEERECTVAVGPSARVRVDGYGSLLLEMLGTEA